MSDWDKLLPWALPSEREAIEALKAHGGNKCRAADALGISRGTLRKRLLNLGKRAARSGYSPDHDMVQTVPEGYHVKGVSSFYVTDPKTGETRLRSQWVKSKADDDERLQLLLEAIEATAEPLKGLADPIPAPTMLADDLLCVYPMGDPHLGLLAWGDETGSDHFDLETACRHLFAAVDQLVDLAPPAKEALIINLGDFFHTDNASNRTNRSGHALDVDTRFPKIYRAGIHVMRRCIERALEKHETVRVICEIGNHDDESARMLATCLAYIYERESRVIVDDSPAVFHWVRFGANLIGVHHGHGTKAQDLPGVMAFDRARDWGETRHRYWYTGHVHHETVKEYPGCVVETFRTLAPRDSWHSAQGYRSGRDMRLDVLHREDGRINRHIVGIEQIKRRINAADKAGAGG